MIEKAGGRRRTNEDVKSISYPPYINYLFYNMEFYSRNVEHRYNINQPHLGCINKKVVDKINIKSSIFIGSIGLGLISLLPFKAFVVYSNILGPMGMTLILVSQVMKEG